MDTHHSIGSIAEQTLDATSELAPGTPVVYALHGRCNIAAVETREMGGSPIRFYKLEIQKSALSRSTRQEPAIWVPVANAAERGLRMPIDLATLDQVNHTLGSREYYFELNQTWTSVQPKLEATIRTEGAIGLAKVASYLHVLKKRQIVATSEVNRMQETVQKILFREISELTGESIRAIEERVTKGFRQKLLPDT